MNLMGRTGANETMPVRDRSLAKRSHFRARYPWSVAGTFPKFGAMSESKSSLMPHIRNRIRRALYRSERADTIGGAGC